MSDIPTESPDVDRELQKYLLMLFPDADEARKFFKKPGAEKMSDEGALGAIHKARVLEFSRMAGESIDWLQEHGMSVPVSREQQIELSNRAAAYFGTTEKEA